MVYFCRRAKRGTTILCVRGRAVMFLLIIHSSFFAQCDWLTDLGGLFRPLKIYLFVERQPEPVDSNGQYFCLKLCDSTSGHFVGIHEVSEKGSALIFVFIEDPNCLRGPAFFKSQQLNVFHTWSRQNFLIEMKTKFVWLDPNPIWVLCRNSILILFIGTSSAWVNLVNHLMPCILWQRLRCWPWWVVLWVTWPCHFLLQENTTWTFWTRSG